MVYIGIDVGGTGVKIGVVDENGKICQQGSIPTVISDTPDKQISDMARYALEVLEKSDYTLDDVASVGVGVPGIADKKTGEVIFCTNLGWHHVPFRQIFQRTLNKPVYIDNDATVAGLAEAVAGVSANADSSVFITLGTGVGGGIVLHGKVWSGFHGTGSEIGHMIIRMDGEPCTCGNRGCMERYCSATAIIRMAREMLPQYPDSVIMESCEGDMNKINARMVVDAARVGDAVGESVFRRYVCYLSQGIANICNVLDPEVIVLGGGVSKSGAFLLDAVRKEVPKYCLFKDLEYARIELAELGADAGLIGAAMLGKE
jgi:glucokinase